MASNSPENFHAFTIRHNGRVRRIITEISVAEGFDPKKHNPNGFKHIPVKALWDTGATGSVITPGLVSALGLKPTGQVKIQHAGGVSNNLTYLVNIVLPNNVAIPGVLVSECPDISEDFGAIIGMDIITTGDLALTNEGNETVMSFRIPSVKCIDYVKESEKLRFAGVGRNDPCPCGKTNLNGKAVKFKRCHGKP